MPHNLKAPGFVSSTIITAPFALQPLTFQPLTLQPLTLQPIQNLSSEEPVSKFAFKFQLVPLHRGGGAAGGVQPGRGEAGGGGRRQLLRPAHGQGVRNKIISGGRRRVMIAANSFLFIYISLSTTLFSTVVAIY